MEPRILPIPLALLTFIVLANAGGLYFTIEPQDVVVEQESPARLDCEAKSDFGKPSIQWRTDDGQPINFIGDSYRSQLANGSLYINSVRNSSLVLTGSYQCLASVDDVGAIVSRTATIKIASLPGFEREPQDTMVYPGQIAYLSCTLLTSSSSLIIQWLKDEHPLLLDDRMTILPSGALEIDDVNIQDVGSYRCSASSYGQSRLSNKAQLGLLTSDIDQESTPPVFIAKPLQQMTIEESTVTLECAANGYPKPSILWLKDGVAIDLTSFQSRYSRVAASSLVISNVQEIDDGSYQCRAENEVETLDAAADLIVQVPPRFIRKPEDKVASENQDLEFECEIYGKPEPKITWLKNGERITLSAYWQIVNGYNLRINGLLLIDAGIFQCIGTNSAGSVQAAARLTINQPKKANPHKSTTPKTVPKKKLLLHRQLYNKTWQHPSTLLGHTMSAFTPNPPLSIGPSDDPADLPGSVKFPNSLYDPKSHFVDDTDSLESIEGSVPSAPRNLSHVIVTARFVTLRWQEPENRNGEILNYYIYYKQEGVQRERVTHRQQKLEAVIQGLQPSMTYQFRVVAVNERGMSGMSSEILQVTTLTEANVPGPPLNLEGHATSSVSIALSWEKPQVVNGRISKYIITFVEGDNEDITRETTSTMHELVDLVPYTEYSIKVQAVNENGPGVFSRDIVVRTYSAQPTQPPHNVTVEPVSPTSIIIRWEPPLEGQNGIVTGYKIRYRRYDRGSQPVTITTEGNQRSRVLTGLEKHVVYQVRICALNVNGTGPWTEWIQIETYETESDENRVPNTPSNLRTKVMSDYIQVFWNPPKDQSIKVKGYKLGWGKGVPDVEVRLLDGKERSFTIDQLEPITEYVISLRATNDAGDGQPAYANVRTTERSVSEFSVPLLPPVGLKAAVLSDTTVVLYWTDTTLPKTQFVTDNRYYVARYTSHHHSSNPRYKYHNATDLNCMINDLKPNTIYEFAVKLVKGKRESLWSMVVTNQTQEAAPSSAPRDLMIQSIGDRPTSVLVRWQPPKQPNGPITGYITFYSIDNTKWDRDWLLEAVVGDKTECIVKGLQPSTTYYFKIQARNSKGYGPFSTTVPFKTPQSSGMDVYDELHDRDGRGLSNFLIYVIVGSSIVLTTGITVVVVIVCCKRNPDSPDRKKGYMKDTNQKTNIKPPDLWIHHDQMELKALEKSSINGEASTSGVASNTLPRSNNQDYNQENVHGNSSSLDKRTYVPSYMAIATATPIVNTSMSQPTIHTSCSDTPSVRQNYPRTVAQYSLSRAHITLEPTPESSPDSCNISTSYEPMQSQQLSYGTSGQSYSGNTQYASGHYSNNNQPSSVGGGVDGGSGSKRMQGHPLKSFSVPAPPPQSAPSTPAQQKHGVSQVTVRPTMSGSPYKKPQSSTQLAKNRLASVSNPVHTSEEVERLKPSYSTEELNQEMANLEGLMKDLNAITASEFEC
ncbi:neogenin isoform X2 [Bombus bifarius]|uniref:Neogenin isoform X2 n=1 Tax=Bombus bifarius TaxID=103933 RepID=A0A6P8MIR6_9HYME|nr:neogenin-like isoform X2 [Bombus vancouverensis nearcticus]XP_033301692.1 neogenin isoform X2 [Bombus bifarius]